MHMAEDGGAAYEERRGNFDCVAAAREVWAGWRFMVREFSVGVGAVADSALFAVVFKRKEGPRWCWHSVALLDKPITS
jgi:hypothetical protein